MLHRVFGELTGPLGSSSASAVPVFRRRSANVGELIARRFPGVGTDALRLVPTSEPDCQQAWDETATHGMNPILLGFEPL
jgi:hypothetical protein